MKKAMLTKIIIGHMVVTGIGTLDLERNVGFFLADNQNDDDKFWEPLWRPFETTLKQDIETRELTNRHVLAQAFGQYVYREINFITED